MQKNTDAGGLAPSKAVFWLLPIVSLVVAADELTKWWAMRNLPDESALDHSSALAFAIHKNWGIAFDIPFKMHLIIAVSVVIGLALLWVARLNVFARPPIAFSALMVMIGAVGNLYDRLAYGYTVDYIILFGRSAINLSDIVIVSGVVLLLYASRVHEKIDKRDHLE